ncbi:MAG: hypothetical protein A3D74_00550 [Candidatus Levybacteria bacterium RIFCSPHIGHO2_02_FULL_37_13]|nr:MAG: hypothetical protein A3D74_00550 [Candidatus Levybacteria bacterium RIFCSPHIGHO2_02_FULL_37_13]OGH29518.1 MAG: hypothetical protein A3E40_00335 [Candidatus Levybacteria bacterium RIFCSPHIGHO2_12_FULL_37_9]OGH37863.1 MAG: hypothetical protein A3B41_01825 [Candidatus Levybacteria bacterium RIFCSPLOWO2_01_FULL_37_26]
MRVTIYQPRYFPQLHYFNRILNSDTFVLLDSAQYTKSLIHLTKVGKERHSSYQSDTPIKLSSGHYSLTVPIKHNGLLPINKTQIDYSHKWVSNHQGVIKSAYSKGKSFDNLFTQVREILLKKYDTLAELDTATIIWGISSVLRLGMDCKDLTLEELNRRLSKTKNIRLKKVLYSSEINAQRPSGLQKGAEWTIAICQNLGATEYYHGATAKDSYMELEDYKKKGVIPITQDWQGIEYGQQFRDKTGFISNLSILDLLFNADQKEALKIIL